MVLYFPSLFSTSETGKVTALPQYSPQGGAVKGPSILLDVTSASKYDVILVRLWSDMKLGAHDLGGELSSTPRRKPQRRFSNIAALASGSKPSESSSNRSTFIVTAAPTC